MFTSVEASNGRKEHVSYSQTKYFYLVLRMPIALKYLKSKKGTNKVMYLFGDSLFNQITKKKKILSVDEIGYFIN